MIIVIKPNVNPKNIPSSLSSTPPCPGRKFPVSFNFAFLFKNEKKRSPSWQKSEVKNPIRKIEKLKTPVL